MCIESREFPPSEFFLTETPSFNSSSTFAWPRGAGDAASKRILSGLLGQAGLSNADQTAARLIIEIGSLAGVLAAPPSYLERLAGPRVAGLLETAKNVMHAALTEEVAKGPVVTDKASVVDLLKLHLGSLRYERLIALYLDTKFALLRIQVVAEGTPRDAPLNLPAIVHAGLDVGATALILVHNHPSGDPTPSRSDRLATSRVARVAADLDMHLLDSLVIAGGEVRSAMHEEKAVVPRTAYRPGADRSWP